RLKLFYLRFLASALFFRGTVLSTINWTCLVCLRHLVFLWSVPYFFMHAHVHMLAQTCRYTHTHTHTHTHTRTHTHTHPQYSLLPTAALAMQWKKTEQPFIPECF